MKLKVFRYSPDTDKKRYEVFEVQTKPGMTVLGALFYIRERLDDSLSFRYSCRGAVCGTCAMLINKVPRLACRTQISKLVEGRLAIELKPYPAIEVTESWDLKEEVLVEPLPHLPILKDLIVDISPFFKFYKAVKPVFKPKDEAPKRERLMPPSVVKELEYYTNCVLCAACFAACPINAKDKEYLGPAALAKLYRFYFDPREGLEDARLDIANHKSGWWGCKFYGNCNRVCPKGVPPNRAIGMARQRLTQIKWIPKKDEEGKL